MACLCFVLLFFVLIDLWFWRWKFGVVGMIAVGNWQQKLIMYVRGTGHCFLYSVPRMWCISQRFVGVWDLDIDFYSSRLRLLKKAGHKSRFTQNKSLFAKKHPVFQSKWGLIIKFLSYRPHIAYESYTTFISLFEDNI